MATCANCARKGRRVKLKAGKLLAVNVKSSPDFPGDKENTFSRGQTVSLDFSKPAMLVDCLKCPVCGHSVSLKRRPEGIRVVGERFS